MHKKPVSNFFDNSIHNLTSWNLHLRRNVSEREVPEVAELLSTLERVKVLRVLEDKWEWELESSRLFTCKSLFKHLIDRPTYFPFNYQHFIWKISIPNKVRVFSWLLVLKKLNTRDLLQKRQPFWSASPSWCVLCRSESEMVNHLFLQCSIAQRVWMYILQKFNVSWVLPQDVNHLIEGDFMVGRDKRTKLLWSLVLHVGFWTLWKERNQRIFEEKTGSLDNIIESVYYWVVL